jgi:hypothetical protein
MRLYLTDSTLLPELRAYLGSHHHVVVSAVGTHELEVSLLGSYCAEAMRMQLYLLVRRWEDGRQTPAVELARMESPPLGDALDALLVGE